MLLGSWLAGIVSRSDGRQIQWTIGTNTHRELWKQANSVFWWCGCAHHWSTEWHGTWEVGRLTDSQWGRLRPGTWLICVRHRAIKLQQKLQVKKLDNKKKNNSNIIITISIIIRISISIKINGPVHFSLARPGLTRSGCSFSPAAGEKTGHTKSDRARPMKKNRPKYHHHHRHPLLY